MNQNTGSNLAVVEGVGGEIAQTKELTEHQLEVLRKSVFPGASDEGIRLAHAYCQARNLDIMKKPVHIVPVWNAIARREVENIWPGIAELRTTASRTGQYAGKGQTEFGPTVTITFSGSYPIKKRDKKRRTIWKKGNLTLKVPEWCRITVKKAVQGHICEFVGPEVSWLETYAQIGKPQDETNFALPNSMWRKRPRGQLEKCAEAAALRCAFPEELGNEYAAEEMVGQHIDGDDFALVDTESTKEEPEQQDTGYMADHPGITDKPDPIVEYAEEKEPAETVTGDLPEQSPLYDQFGVIMGTYLPREYLTEFRSFIDFPGTPHREKEQFIENNYATAVRIYIHCGGVSHDFDKKLADAGFPRSS